jgi:hypothetical protein
LQAIGAGIETIHRAIAGERVAIRHRQAGDILQGCREFAAIEPPQTTGAQRALFLFDPS